MKVKKAVSIVPHRPGIYHVRVLTYDSELRFTVTLSELCRIPDSVIFLSDYSVVLRYQEDKDYDDVLYTDVILYSSCSFTSDIDKLLHKNLVQILLEVDVEKVVVKQFNELYSSGEKISCNQEAYIDYLEVEKLPF